MNTAFYIAKRYLFARKSHNVINVISAICSIGMGVGTAALILILSVYNGFEDLIKDNLSKIDPDILITCMEGRRFTPSQDVFSILEQDEAVESFCCVLEDNIFFTYADRQGIAKARGVDYGYEEQSGIRDLTVEGEFSLYKGDIPQACIGATLAYNNGIHVKFLDPLDLYYPDGGKDISLINPEASLNHSRIWPGSLISVTSTVDAGTMIVPLATMQELTGNYDELTGIEVRLKDGSEASVRKFIKSSPLNGEFILKDRFSQNPSLFRMMEFEKLAIMMILLFVVVIVAFNVFGSLSMLIMEKKEDCSTLRAMGADEKLIRRIFIIEGWLVTLVGMAAGAVFGTGLAILQQHTGIIKMPGSFSVSAYPVALHWFDVLASCLAVAAIGILIALPAASARRD